MFNENTSAFTFQPTQPFLEIYPEGTLITQNAYMRKVIHGSILCNYKILETT